MYAAVKRILDCSIALLALLILLPVMMCIALAVLRRMGRPVLFRQTRPGLHEKPFVCLKFRTMRNERRTAAGVPLTDSERLTRLGRWLRRTSLDELPQLWNVIRGNMSLVGPRPLLTEYIPYYTSEEKRRHLVRPGITGWAQIHGRNYLPFATRLAMDTWYVDHASWLLDIRILAATLRVVITGNGFAERPEECATLVDERRPQILANHVK